MSDAAERRVGLCEGCAHGRRVASARGSVFWRCARSEGDPTFPKYPRLPVLRCPGYEANAPAGHSATSDARRGPAR